jgi:hypothetical protein
MNFTLQNILIIIIVTFFINIKNGNAQTLDMVGIAVISKTEMVPYKLIFDEKNGKISGYSISDFNGANETKSTIVGTFNKKNKTFSFEETSIVSTKSKVSKSEFCLLKMDGKFIKKAGKEIVQGAFTSNNSNKEIECVSGNLLLTPSKNVYELMAKFAGKVDTSKVKDAGAKQMLNEVNSYKDVGDVIELKAGDSPSFKWRSDTIRIAIWDENMEDGDQISISKGDEVIASAYSITNKKKIFSYVIAKGSKTKFTIKAINEGMYPPNTVKIMLIDRKESSLLLSKLNTGQSASFNIIK